MSIKIDRLLSSINEKDYADEDDLNILKEVNSVGLLSIFKKVSSNVNGAIYLLKCYLTVLDKEVLEEVYEENSSLVELGFSKLWLFEIKKSKHSDLIEAYIPLKIFNSKVLKYFRNGITSYLSDELFEFNTFFNDLILKITEKKEFIVSKIMFNNYDYTNEYAIKIISEEDIELGQELEQIVKNLSITNTLINFSYINDKKEQKRLHKIIKKDISEYYQDVDMEIVSSFFPEEVFTSLNVDFKLIKKSFWKKKKKKNNIKNKEDLEVDFKMQQQSIGDGEEVLPSVPNSELEREEESYPELEVVKREGVSKEVFENLPDLNVLTESELVDSFYIDPVDVKNSSKRNRFSENFEKKNSNTKIIMFSIAIIVFSFILAYKLISMEIENENKILGDSGQINVSYSQIENES